MQLEINRTLFAVLLFVAPMSVTPWNKMALVLVFLISLFMCVIFLVSRGRLLIEKLPLNLLLCYVTMFCIGFLSLIIHSGEPFGIFISPDSLGRLFTITSLTLALMAGYAFISSLTDEAAESIRWIWLLPGFTFVMFGIYQVYCNLTGTPFIIDTRDWMHGVPKVIQDAVPKRVTSIAEEPSFVAPILIEAFLLSYFLIYRTALKYTVLAVIAALLLLTFSGGAYVNALFIGLVAVAIVLWRFPLGKIHFSLFLLLLLALGLLFSVGQILIEFAINKFVHEAAGGSSRAVFMSDLLTLQFTAPPFSLLFGHGMTSLSQLGEFGMRAEDVLFRISNNMFLDILWESGILGLVAMVLLFTLLLKQSLAIQVKLHKQLSLSFLLTCQMIVTGMYRSEYISTHLIWMLLLVVWAIKWESAKLNGENYLKRTINDV